MAVSNVLLSLACIIAASSWEVLPREITLAIPQGSSGGSGSVLHLTSDEGEPHCGRWFLEDPCGPDCGLELNDLHSEGNNNYDDSESECGQSASKSVIVRAIGVAPFSRRIRVVSQADRNGLNTAWSTVRVVPLKDIKLSASSYTISTGVPTRVEVMAGPATGSASDRIVVDGIKLLWTVQKPSFCRDPECLDCAWGDSFPDSDSDALSVANPEAIDAGSAMDPMKRFVEGRQAEPAIQADNDGAYHAVLGQAALLLEPRISGRIVLCAAIADVPAIRTCTRFRVLERLFTIPKGPLILAPASTLRLQLFKRSADGTETSIHMPSHQFVWLMDNLRVASVGIHHGIVEAHQEGATKLVVFDMHLRDKPAALLAQHDLGCSDGTDGLPRCTEEEIGGLVIDLEVSAPTSLMMWLAPHQHHRNSQQKQSASASLDIPYSKQLCPLINMPGLRGVLSSSSREETICCHQHVPVTCGAGEAPLVLIGGYNYSILIQALTVARERIAEGDNVRFQISVMADAVGQAIRPFAIGRETTEGPESIGGQHIYTFNHTLGVELRTDRHISADDLYAELILQPNNSLKPVLRGILPNWPMGSLAAHLLSVHHPRTRVEWQPESPMSVHARVLVMNPLQILWPMSHKQAGSVVLPTVEDTHLTADILTNLQPEHVSYKLYPPTRCAKLDGNRLHAVCEGYVNVEVANTHAPEDTAKMRVQIARVEQLSFFAETLRSYVGDEFVVPFTATGPNDQPFDDCTALGPLVQTVFLVPDETKRNVQDAPPSTSLILETLSVKQLESQHAFKVPEKACGFVAIRAVQVGAAAVIIKLGDLVASVKVSVFLKPVVLFPPSAIPSNSADVILTSGSSIPLVVLGGPQAFDAHCRQELCDKKTMRGVTVQQCITDLASGEQDCSNPLYVSSMPDMEDVPQSDVLASTGVGQVALVDVAAVLQQTTKGKTLIPCIMMLAKCKPSTSSREFLLKLITGFDTSENRFFAETTFNLSCIPATDVQWRLTAAREVSLLRQIREARPAKPLNVTGVAAVPMGERAVMLVTCTANGAAAKPVHNCTGDHFISRLQLPSAGSSAAAVGVGTAPVSLVRLLEEFAPDLRLLRTYNALQKRRPLDMLLARLQHEGHDVHILTAAQGAPPALYEINASVESSAGEFHLAAHVQYIEAPTVDLEKQITLGGNRSHPTFCCRSGSGSFVVEMKPPMGILVARDATCYEVQGLPALHIEPVPLKITCVDTSAGQPGITSTLMLDVLQKMSLTFLTTSFVEGDSYQAIIGLTGKSGTTISSTSCEVELTARLIARNGTEPVRYELVQDDQWLTGIVLHADSPGVADVTVYAKICDSAGCLEVESNTVTIQVNRRLRIFPASMVMLPGSSLLLHIESAAKSFALMHEQSVEVSAASRLSMKSSDEAVATVDSSGYVYAVREGAATIRLTEYHGDKELHNEVPVVVRCPGAISIAIQAAQEGAGTKEIAPDLPLWAAASDRFELTFVTDFRHSSLVLASAASIRWFVPDVDEAGKTSTPSPHYLSTIPYSREILSFQDEEEHGLEGLHQGYGGYVVHMQARSKVALLHRTMICAEVAFISSGCTNKRLMQCIHVIVVPSADALSSFPPPKAPLRLFAGAHYPLTPAAVPQSDMLESVCAANFSALEEAPDVATVEIRQQPVLVVHSCAGNIEVIGHLDIRCSFRFRDTRAALDDVPEFHEVRVVNCGYIHHYALTPIEAGKASSQLVLPLQIKAGSTALLKLTPYDQRGKRFSVGLRSLCPRGHDGQPERSCNGDSLGIELYSSDHRIVMPGYLEQHDLDSAFGDQYQDSMIVQISGLLHGRAAILAHPRHDDNTSFWEGIIPVQVHSKVYPSSEFVVVVGSSIAFSHDDMKFEHSCLDGMVSRITNGGLEGTEPGRTLFVSSDASVLSIDRSSGCAIANSVGMATLTVSVTLPTKLSGKGRTSAMIGKVRIHVVDRHSLRLVPGQGELQHGYLREFHQFTDMKAGTAFFPVTSGQLTSDRLGWPSATTVLPWAVTAHLVDAQNRTILFHPQVRHPFSWSCAVETHAAQFSAEPLLVEVDSSRQMIPACFLRSLELSHALSALSKYNLSLAHFSLFPINQAGGPVRLRFGFGELADAHVAVTLHSPFQVVPIQIAPRWFEDGQTSNWDSSLRQAVTEHDLKQMLISLRAGPQSASIFVEALHLDPAGHIVLTPRSPVFACLLLGGNLHSEHTGPAFKLQYDPRVRVQLHALDKGTLTQAARDIFSTADQVRLAQTVSFMCGNGHCADALLIASPALMPIHCLSTSALGAECQPDSFAEAQVHVANPANQSVSLTFRYIGDVVSTIKDVAKESPEEVVLFRALTFVMKLLPAIAIGFLGALFVTWKLTKKS